MPSRPEAPRDARDRLRTTALRGVAAVTGGKHGSPDGQSRWAPLILDRDAASRLSRDLRLAGGRSMARRRRIVSGSTVASMMMTGLTLFQTGVIAHVPEPGLPGLDADKVDASPEAYQFLATPDAALGLVSYAITVVLAAAGDANRTTSAPWLPLLLGAKVALDAAYATKLTIDQGTKHKAVCSWCVVATLATYSTVPAAVGEVRDGWRALRAGAS